MSNATLLRKLYERYDIVLGSSSPRRKEILIKNIGFEQGKIKIFKPSFEENLDKQLYKNNLLDYVAETVRCKATSLVPDLEKHHQENPGYFSHDKILVICCDTTLIDLANGVIYEKPRDKQDQLKNLKNFCYNLGQVECVSSVCLMEYSLQNNKYKFLESFNCTTNIKFDKSIPEFVLNDYVESKEAEDAAGGFKIQETASVFITSIDGDFYNVMGFPVNQTVQKLLTIV